MRLKELRLSAIPELIMRTGCNMVFAKIWVFHTRGPHEPDVKPPCPYCGEPLFTDQTKQCRHCGWDWHDLEHPRNLKKTQQPATG